jgi:hypothetical protein
MSVNNTCAISSSISFLISVDMDGERPGTSISSEYLPFISHVETKAALRGVIGIVPRKKLAHPHSFRMVSSCLTRASS